MSDLHTLPAHYPQIQAECVDAIEAALTGPCEDGFEAFCRGTIIACLWPDPDKSEDEAGLDLRDAHWFLERLLRHRFLCSRIERADEEQHSVPAELTADELERIRTEVDAYAMRDLPSNGKPTAKPKRNGARNGAAANGPAAARG